MSLTSQKPASSLYCHASHLLGIALEIWSVSSWTSLVRHEATTVGQASQRIAAIGRGVVESRGGFVARSSAPTACRAGADLHHRRSAPAAVARDLARPSRGLADRWALDRPLGHVACRVGPAHMQYKLRTSIWHRFKNEGPAARLCTRIILPRSVSRPSTTAFVTGRAARRHQQAEAWRGVRRAAGGTRLTAQDHRHVPQGQRRGEDGRWQRGRRHGRSEARRRSHCSTDWAAGSTTSTSRRRAKSRSRARPATSSSSPASTSVARLRAPLTRAGSAPGALGRRE